MRSVGFSTGALAYADFHRGLKMLSDAQIKVVEVSALRFAEWLPLVDSIDTLDLSSFEYISIHLPSKMNQGEEQVVAASLRQRGNLHYPLILHPDAISDWQVWHEFGDRVCIENMDIRKPIGRTDQELEVIFNKLPRACLCFDIGHAWQVDSTMGEAYWILKSFKSKLKQIHVSEVNSRSKHDVLSYSTIRSFKQMAHMIPDDIPLILESPVTQDQMCDEIAKARFALTAVVESELVA